MRERSGYSYVMDVDTCMLKTVCALDVFVYSNVDVTRRKGGSNWELPPCAAVMLLSSIILVLSVIIKL